MKNPSNHLQYLLTHAVAIFATLAVGLTASAQTVTATSYTGIEDGSAIVTPDGTPYVVTAVNVGDTSPDTVNGITFLADTSAAATSTDQTDFVGTGYTATTSNEEDSGGVSDAEFTQTTVNLGAVGTIVGDTLSGLSLDTPYSFVIYLSDNNGGRGTEFSYTLGGNTTAVDLVQDVGSVNAYEVDFNTGTSTTFDWGLASTMDHHDAKLSGFALYSASPVPEPSTTALLAVIGGGLALVLSRRATRV